MSRYLQRVHINLTTCTNCGERRVCVDDGTRDPLCSPCLTSEWEYARQHLTEDEIGTDYRQWMTRAQDAIARAAGR